MIDVCSAPVDAPLIAGLTGSVDCATRSLAAGGYAALAAPAGPVAAALTGLLTLYVGLVGYRLLLGRGTLDVGGVSLTVVKIGLVVVLAGNWAIYQQVVASTLFDAPATVARILAGGLQHPGAVLNADPFVALQQTFDELLRDVRSLATHAGTASPLLGGTPFATMMLNADAYGLVFSSVGVIIAARIGLALLLALGPVIAAFLLFDATRGLVEGWLRIMVALSLVSLSSMVLLSVELSILEPVLVALSQQRLKDTLTAEGAMTATFVITIFLLVQVGTTIAALMIANGLRLPRLSRRTPNALSALTSPPTLRAPEATLARAAQIAAAAEASARRSGTSRAVPAAALQSTLATADRHRSTTTVQLPSGSIAMSAHTHRATRPRRELLISRRKR